MTAAPLGTETPELRATLGTGRVALLVVAAAAPLASMIGNVPIGILLGNGPGLPVAFAFAAVMIGMLATGYLAMSRELPEAGGFVTFVRAGLGRHLGRGAGYATALSYTAGAVALAAGTGYLSSLIIGGLGFHLPWWVWAAVAMVFVTFLGRRAADISAGVLVALMLAEFLVLIVMDAGILVQHGFAAFTLDSMQIGAVLGGNPGPALMVAFTSFIGIESAVLYSKETRKPEKSVPRATMAAVVVIGVFYFVSVWLFIGSVGAGNIGAFALKEQGATVFAITGMNSGPFVLTIAQIFFCTSLLACLLALHNAAARYVHTLAAESSLPQRFAAIHQRHRSPHVASDLVAGITVLVLAVCAVLRADPYIGVNTTLTGLFTVGVIGLQVLVALAVIVHFRRRRDRRIWTTLIAPLLGGLGVAAAVALIIANYPILTNTNSPIANALPALIGICLVAGIAVEHRLQRRVASRVIISDATPVADVV